MDELMHECAFIRATPCPDRVRMNIADEHAGVKSDGPCRHERLAYPPAFPIPNKTNPIFSYTGRSCVTWRARWAAAGTGEVRANKTGTF